MLCFYCQDCGASVSSVIIRPAEGDNSSHLTEQSILTIWPRCLSFLHMLLFCLLYAWQLTVNFISHERCARMPYYALLFPHTDSKPLFVDLFFCFSPCTIASTLPVQDGLQVQDDLSLVVVATGLPFFLLHCQQMPWRHGDLSTRHRPPHAELHAQRATHAC